MIFLVPQQNIPFSISCFLKPTKDTEPLRFRTTSVRELLTIAILSTIKCSSLNVCSKVITTAVVT